MFMDMEQFLVPPWFLQQEAYPSEHVHHEHHLQSLFCSSRTPFWCYFFLHFLSFIYVRLEDLPCRNISLPSCWPWSFLEWGKGGCTGTGGSCRHYNCCLVLSHFHTSQQHAVPTCPWMILPRNDESFWGTLLGVSCCFPALMFVTLQLLPSSLFYSVFLPQPFCVLQSGFPLPICLPQIRFQGKTF